MNANVERRYHATEDLQIRAEHDALTAHFSGYATVYDFEYDVFGGPSRGGWTEVIRPGAGQVTLHANPDVRLLVDHEGRPLARTTRNTLTLEEDRHGLYADAPSLDMRMPSVQDIVYPLERGDVDQMSFAFRTGDDRWNGDYTFREITSYDLTVKGADVSIVTYPANDATLAMIRSASGVDELRASLVERGGLDVRIARAIADRLREEHHVPG